MRRFIFTTTKARRGWALLALVLVVASGLSSRNPEIPVPEFLAAHLGDALWTVAVYLCLCLWRPAAHPAALALAALLVSVAVECSQLVQVDWLVALRRTRLGGLLLGSGFLWIDLLRYLVGAAGAGAVDAALRRRRRLTD